MSLIAGKRRDSMAASRSPTRPSRPECIRRAATRERCDPRRQLRFGMRTASLLASLPSPPDHSSTNGAWRSAVGPLAARDFRGSLRPLDNRTLRGYKYTASALARKRRPQDLTDRDQATRLHGYTVPPRRRRRRISRPHRAIQRYEPLPSARVGSAFACQKRCAAVQRLGRRRGSSRGPSPLSRATRWLQSPHERSPFRRSGALTR
jgi:hypothetical protein